MPRKTRSTLKSPIKKIKSAKDIQRLQGKSGLLRFVMDGCHFCKESEGDWKDACRSMVPHPSNFFAEMEQQFLPMFMSSSVGRTTPEITGFPTIVVIKDGNFEKTLERRDADSIARESLEHDLSFNVKRSKRSRKKNQRSRISSK